MNRYRRICALCVGAVLVAASTVRAQDTIQVTYGDLVQRIQELEARQAELERMPGIGLADYQSACGFSQGGCGYDGCGCDMSGCGCDGCGCDSYGCGSNCGCGCGCCGTDGYYALYENVLVVPHFSRNFAMLRIDDSGPGDLYEEISFDRDLTYTPRVEIGRLNGCGGFGWRARWWHLDSDAREDQNLNSTQEALAAYGGSDGADIEFDQNGPSNVTAIHDLQFDVIDLEASRQCGNSLYSLGIRYANMDQQYVIFSPTDNGLYGQHDFEGLGPTIAGEWYHPVSCRVQVFAKARGSLLYGRSTFYAVDVEDGTSSDVIYRQNDYDLITVGEVQLGVDWRVPVGCSSTFFVTAALEGQAWLNAGSGAPGLLDGDDGNYQDESAQNADLGVVGATIGTGFIF